MACSLVPLCSKSIILIWSKQGQVSECAGSSLIDWSAFFLDWLFVKMKWRTSRKTLTSSSDCFLLRDVSFTLKCDEKQILTEDDKTTECLTELLINEWEKVVFAVASLLQFTLPPDLNNVIWILTRHIKISKLKTLWRLKPSGLSWRVSPPSPSGRCWSRFLWATFDLTRRSEPRRKPSCCLSCTTRPSSPSTTASWTETPSASSPSTAR